MIIKVATSLRNSYGNTLVEQGADLMMATDLIRNIKNELSFAKTEVIDRKAFLKWRVKFLEDANMQPRELAEEHAQEDWDRIKGFRFR